MTKLTDLKGSENLPNKDILPLELQHLSMEIYRKEQSLTPLLNEVRNTVIDQYNSLSIDGDVEALARILIDENIKYLAENARYMTPTQMAQSIIANLDKFVVIRKG